MVSLQGKGEAWEAKGKPQDDWWNIVHDILFSLAQGIIASPLFYKRKTYKRKAPLFM